MTEQGGQVRRVGRVGQAPGQTELETGRSRGGSVSGYRAESFTEPQGVSSEVTVPILGPSLGVSGEGDVA